MKLKHLLFLSALVATLGATFALTLREGDAVKIAGCDTRLRLSNATTVVCVTRTPTRTFTPSPTATSTPTPTATDTPSATPTEHVHDTATPEVQLTALPTSTAPAGALPPVDVSILGTCTAAIHDRYTTIGPDGKTYRTWHAQAVPVNESEPFGALCRFAHEHGDNPRDSAIFSTLPPFGYVVDTYNAGATVPHPVEPHQGFKVAVGNRGEVNDEGRAHIGGNSLVVFHMGTGGTARYTQRHHSAIIEYELTNGRRVKVMGLFDTFGVGSICERDRVNNDNNFSNDIGRTVLTLPGTGCEVTSPYEIWSGSFDVRNTAGRLVYRAFVTMAVFDTITTLNPFDLTELIYTEDAFATRRNEAPFMGDFRGCDRENYHSAGNWYNASGPTVYYTDAFGNPLAQGAAGALRQEVGNYSAETILISQRAGEAGLNQFKERDYYCGAGLGVKN